MSIRFDKNKKIIEVLLCISCILLAFFCLFGFLSISKFLYIEIYLILSIICFVISINWISTLSLFWLQYTIYSLGYIFSHTKYLYDPFFVVLGSFLFLLIGYYAGSVTKGMKIKKYRIERSLYIRMKWKNIIEIMYVFSTIMWGWYIIKNRRFLFGGNLETGRVDAMSGNGIFLYSIMLHVMYIPLLYILLKKQEINQRIFGILVLISCTELISVGYRTPLIISIFSVLVINARLKKFDIKKAVPYFFLMFLVAMIFEIVRAGGTFSFSALLERFTSRFDVCMWNYNFIVATFPKYIPFQHGYTNMIDLIMLLPGPGQDFSLWLKDAVGISYDGGGLVTFIQGSFYIDFGTPGIVIGMFLLGFFKSKIDKKINANNYITFWGAYIPYAFSMVCGCITGTFILPAILYTIYKIMEHFAIDDISLKRLDIV